MGKPVQKSLFEVQTSVFEDGYLVRTMGEIAYRPEVAIAELISNAWDAGASQVRVEIPDKVGEAISVDDDGVGLNPTQFTDRWMKLGYQRRVHQSIWAEMPYERRNVKRKALGKNGIGRHAMLCFAKEYHVDSLRDRETIAHKFTVAPSSKESPFVLKATSQISRPNHGTRVWTTVVENLPLRSRIQDAIALTFLSDPSFEIFLNGSKIGFDSFEVVDEEHVKIETGSCVVKFLKLPEAKQKARTGVAFWAGNRLVGQPSYHLFGQQLIDGRSSVARNHFVIVQSDDLSDFVRPDWSGFDRTEKFLTIADEVADHVSTVASRLNRTALDDTKKAAYIENSEGIRSLTVLGKTAVKDFVDGFVNRVPGINSDTLAAGIAVTVNLEQSRSGRKLLNQLALFTGSEIELLSKLLKEWTVTDAMVVLDEISRRGAAVQAIKKLKGDPNADELNTMHPLVAHCRWLFGPEFDSPFFLSNTTIRSAAEKVFNKVIDPKQIANPRQRPDLVFAKSATFGISAVDDIDSDTQMTKLSKLLLIELKRGDTKIVLKHIQQAQTYIQDLLACGLLDGRPHIYAFVVGYEVDPKLQNVYKDGDPEVSRIQPVSFDQLVRTAESRLFGITKAIESHFSETDASQLIDRILGDSTPDMFPDFPKGNRKKKRRR